MIQVYGITGCDKVKESLAWLKKHNVSFCFHDLKKECVPAPKLNNWIGKTKGKVLNKKSTTSRSLSADVQEKLNDASEAIKIMQEQPTIIKRPVIEFGNEVMAGFDADLFFKTSQLMARFQIPTTRIEAFSDGVFAIVITLLAFQFKVPEFTAGVGLKENYTELLEVSTNLFSFVFSFLYVAVFWVNHHQLFHAIKDADRKLLWLNIHLLFWITMIPFPTGMVGDYPDVSLAAISLAVVMLMVSVSSYMVRHYSFNHAEAIKESSSARIIKAGLSRNLIAIVLNLIAIGTSFISVKISYAIFIVVLILFILPHKVDFVDESQNN